MRGIRFKHTNETIQKVEKIVRDAVEERFRDELVFDPIIVESRIDPVYDYEYLHIYVVYKGDPQKLDPTWTLGLTGLIIDQTTEEELPGVPSTSFVLEREWKQVHVKRRRESGLPC